MIDRGQVAPDGADICYGILSCCKQVAPTELLGNTFFKKLKCYHFCFFMFLQIYKSASPALMGGVRGG